MASQAKSIKRISDSEGTLGRLDSFENGNGNGNGNGGNNDIFAGSNWGPISDDFDPVRVYKRQKQNYYFHPSYDESKLTDPDYKQCKGLKKIEYEEGKINGCIESCPWYELNPSPQRCKELLDRYCPNWLG